MIIWQINLVEATSSEMAVVGLRTDTTHPDSLADHLCLAAPRRRRVHATPARRNTPEVFAGTTAVFD